MNIPDCLSKRFAIAAVLVCMSCGIVDAADVPVQRAAQLGGAIPGGAVVSARSVILTPVAGGASTAVPLAADGSFNATGLAPGTYILRVSSASVGKQTQGASFGEKVNQGLHAAGGALAQGASKQGINGINPNGMPNRLSMNVTVGRRTAPVDVDGDGLSITVSTDGALGGVVKAP